jgi:hypothetical protein
VISPRSSFRSYRLTLRPALAANSSMSLFLDFALASEEPATAQKSKKEKKKLVEEVEDEEMADVDFDEAEDSESGLYLRASFKSNFSA